MKMYNHLTAFLVENNYARDEYSALKMLCSVSDSFYDYIVCESSPQDLKKLKDLQDLLERLRSKKGADPSRISSIESQISEIRERISQQAPGERERRSAGAERRKQERKIQLKTSREEGQTARDRENLAQEAEKALAELQDREPEQTPRTPSSVRRPQRTWTSGGANKPRDVIRTDRTPGTNPDYVNPDERRQTPDIRQQHTLTRGDRSRAGRDGSTSNRFTNN